MSSRELWRRLFFSVADTLPHFKCDMSYYVEGHSPCDMCDTGLGRKWGEWLIGGSGRREVVTGATRRTPVGVLTGVVISKYVSSKSLALTS